MFVHCFFSLLFHLLFNIHLLCAQAARPILSDGRKDAKTAEGGVSSCGARLCLRRINRLANRRPWRQHILPSSAAGSGRICRPLREPPGGSLLFWVRLVLISAPQQATGEAAGGYSHRPAGLFRRAALPLSPGIGSGIFTGWQCRHRWRMKGNTSDKATLPAGRAKRGLADIVEPMHVSDSES